MAVIRKGANNSGNKRKFTVGVRKFAILLLLSVQILQLLLGFRVWSTAPLDWNLAYNGVYLTVQREGNCKTTSNDNIYGSILVLSPNTHTHTSRTARTHRGSKRAHTYRRSAAHTCRPLTQCARCTSLSVCAECLKCVRCSVLIVCVCYALLCVCVFVLEKCFDGLDNVKK